MYLTYERTIPNRDLFQFRYLSQAILVQIIRFKGYCVESPFSFRFKEEGRIAERSHYIVPTLPKMNNIDNAAFLISL